MKIFITVLLIFFGVFVAYDVFRVANLWHDYQTKDVIVHSIFAIGAFVIIGLNLYFIFNGMSQLGVSAHFKIALLIFGQVIILCLFSLFSAEVWKGYLFEKGSPNFVWSMLGTFCFLLFLLILFAALVVWSRNLSMSQPPGSTRTPQTTRVL